MRAVGGLGSRDAALERLEASDANPLDVLVVGGGITGAGIALDAASRGMTVGLVERFDFASGTSSKSSKLVHGGLRYLEQREFGLVREASTERDLLARLAPHLVTPIPFVIPIASRWRRAMFGVGLWTYDALASFKNLKVHRYVDRSQAETLVPPLTTGSVRGGYIFYDGKTDDVRLVMEVLIQAVRHGASAANYAVVRDLRPGDPCSATVEDTVSGTVVEVVARRVAIAAGVWTDRVAILADDTAGARIRPSKGIHLVFARDAIPMANAAAFIPDAQRRRMLFVIPWLDSVLVGTTDTAYAGSLDAPVVEHEDRRYCLDAVNAAFDLELTEEDIAGAYAGLRPLIAGRAGATADLSRRHAIYDIAPGIIGITGGKLTTYRRMALDAVDRIAEDLAVTAPSRTRRIRLGSADLAALTLAVERRARTLGVDLASAGSLVRTYGDRALNVLDVAADEDLRAPVVSGCLPIAAEAVYCARSEMTVHLSDLLARRTRLALVDASGGIGETSAAAELMGGELGWSPTHRSIEIAAHRAEIERERNMPLRPVKEEVAARDRARTG